MQPSPLGDAATRTSSCLTRSSPSRQRWSRCRCSRTLAPRDSHAQESAQVERTDPRVEGFRKRNEIDRARLRLTAASTDCKCTSSIALEKWIEFRCAKARASIPIAPEPTEAVAGSYQLPPRDHFDSPGESALPRHPRRRSL
jgi:hypothetical protein